MKRYYLTKDLDDGTEIAVRVINRTHARILRKVLRFFGKKEQYFFEEIAPTPILGYYEVKRDGNI